MNTKKEHILEVSEILFAEKGYEAVTTREIAKACNVNIAMISYYFGSKEKLYESVITYRIFSFEEIMLDINALGTSEEKLSLLLDVIIDKFWERKYFQKIIFRELSTENRGHINEKIRNQLFANFINILKIIYNGIESHQFRQVNVPLTLFSIVGTINMYISSEKIFDSFGLELLPYKNEIESKKLLKSHLMSFIGNHLIYNTERNRDEKV